MRLIRRLLVFVGIVGSFCLGWLAHTQPDVVTAQSQRNAVTGDSVERGPVPDSGALPRQVIGRVWDRIAYHREHLLYPAPVL